MTRLATPSLQGTLDQQQTLVTTLVYRSVEPWGSYGYVTRKEAASEEPSASWHRTPATGIVVVRKTGAENSVQVYLLLSSTQRYPIGALTDSPDDVQLFIEQYAPEVDQQCDAWERGELLVAAE